MTENKGRLTRFTTTTRRQLMKRVEASVLDSHAAVLDPIMTFLTDTTIKLWIGDEWAEFEETSRLHPRWFRVFPSIRFRHDDVCVIVLNKLLPITPAWNPNLNEDEWWRWAVDPPAVLVNTLNEHLRLRRIAHAEVSRITSELNVVLNGARYVRDVRAAIPELTHMLPPDREPITPAPVAAERALDAGTFTRVRASLRAIGIRPTY